MLYMYPSQLRQVRQLSGQSTFDYYVAVVPEYMRECLTFRNYCQHLTWRQQQIRACTLKITRASHPWSLRDIMGRIIKRRVAEGVSEKASAKIE